LLERLDRAREVTGRREGTAKIEPDTPPALGDRAHLQRPPEMTAQRSRVRLRGLHPAQLVQHINQGVPSGWLCERPLEVGDRRASRSTRRGKACGIGEHSRHPRIPARIGEQQVIGNPLRTQPFPVQHACRPGVQQGALPGRDVGIDGRPDDRVGELHRPRGRHKPDAIEGIQRCLRLYSSQPPARAGSASAPSTATARANASASSPRRRRRATTTRATLRGPSPST
jgi:hypothetical protein